MLTRASLWTADPCRDMLHGTILRHFNRGADVTEQQWESCAEPGPLLTFLRANGKLPDAQVRLFAAACCRRLWHLLTDERSQRAVEVAEWYATGRASANELEEAIDQAKKAWDALDKGDPLP